MNRAEFQQLAELRIKEAKVLLDAQCWEGAYYLAGYAVECGLKACILARVERDGVIFEEKDYSQQCWTHDIKSLLKLAGLTVERGKEGGTNPQFAAYWQIAEPWKEGTRYKSKGKSDAEALYQAITDTTDGVLRWIRARW